MFDTQNPQPTDQPENTGGGTRTVTSPESTNDETDTDQPENTGGGTSQQIE